MMLWGARDGVLPLWAGLLVFSPFIVDATVTLLRRILRGERVWEAHKTHYYQRLVQLGWGHRKTVVVEYGLMLACATSALAANSLGVKVQVFIVCAWCVVYGALMVGIDRMSQKRKTA
jgi:UDP-N-acetylmuramyl pentapeptide phosphotransferase/UDP-N-acetylglucosamine-1-phosphate transferase